MPTTSPIVQTLPLASAILAVLIVCTALVLTGRRARSIVLPLIAAGFAYCFPKLLTVVSRELTTVPVDGFAGPLFLLVAIVLLGWALLKLIRQIPSAPSQAWTPGPPQPPDPAPAGSPPEFRTEPQP